MPNRRQFLQTSAAVSAVAANGMIASATGAAAAGAVRLGRAIYDDRYAEGRRFAEVVAGHGVPVRSLDNGDITRFWYAELEPLWRREPVAIAGLTQFGPMFVVERLALEHGLRVVLRVEHCSRGGMLDHSFSGPRDTVALAGGFDALDADWPGLIGALACGVAADDSPHYEGALESAGAVSRVTRDPGAPSVIHYYTPLGVQQGYGPELDGPLYSWVVAPRVRA